MLTSIILNRERDVTGIQSYVAGMAETFVLETFYHPDINYGTALFRSQGGIAVYLNFLEKTLEELDKQKATPEEQAWLEKLRNLTEYCRDYTKVKTREEIDTYIDKLVELVDNVWLPQIRGQSIPFKKRESIKIDRQEYKETQQEFQC